MHAEHGHTIGKRSGVYGGTNNKGRCTRTKGAGSRNGIRRGVHKGHGTANGKELDEEFKTSTQQQQQ